MSDFTKTILALVAVLIFLQISRLVYKVIGDDGFSIIGLGSLFLVLGYLFNIPYVGYGMMIFGGCLVTIGFIAIIGAGVDADDTENNANIAKDDDYVSEENVNWTPTDAEIENFVEGFTSTFGGSKEDLYDIFHRVYKKDNFTITGKYWDDLQKNKDEKYSFLKDDDIVDEWLTKIDDIVNSNLDEDEQIMKMEELDDQMKKKFESKKNAEKNV